MLCGRSGAGSMSHSEKCWAKLSIFGLGALEEVEREPSSRSTLLARQIPSNALVMAVLEELKEAHAELIPTIAEHLEALEDEYDDLPEDWLEEYHQLAAGGAIGRRNK
ncbi:hypothetical protein JCM8547_007068 [Rhodosporidiobolus lusitaniae]